MRISVPPPWIMLVAAIATAGALVLGLSRSQTTARANASSEPLVTEPSAVDRSDAPATEADCAGVFYPIELNIEPLEPASAGEISTATVRVSTRQLMGEIEVSYAPSPGLEWLEAGTRERLERLRPGDLFERTIAVRLPATLERRVVEVTVRGWVHGSPVERSAIWNLVPGGEEPSREVTRPDGGRVREVAARRLP